MNDQKQLKWNRRERMDGDPIWFALLGGFELWVQFPGTAWMWEWSILDADDIELARGELCVMKDGEWVGNIDGSGDEWDYQGVELAQQRCEQVAYAVLATENPLGVPNDTTPTASLSAAPETADREHDPAEAREMATDWLEFDPKGGDGESAYERAKGNVARWALHCAGERERLREDLRMARIRVLDMADGDDPATGGNGDARAYNLAEAIETALAGPTGEPTSDESEMETHLCLLNTDMECDRCGEALHHPVHTRGESTAGPTEEKSKLPDEAGR